MSLDYTLDENDYLRYHMYQLKTDNNIKKTMKLSWLSLVLVYSGMMWFFYAKFGLSVGFCVILVPILLIVVFYPKFYENSCKRRILKFTRKNYYLNSQIRLELDVTSDIITAKMQDEFKLEIKNITKLVKIPQNLFIIFKNPDKKDTLSIILKNDEISAKFMELVSEKTGLSIKKEI